MELTVKHLHTGDTTTHSDVTAVGTAFDEDGELLIVKDTMYKLSLHTIRSLTADSADAEVLIVAAYESDEEWAKTVHNIDSVTEVDDNGVEIVFEDGTEDTYSNARIFGAAEDPQNVPHRRYAPGVATDEWG